MQKVVYVAQRSEVGDFKMRKSIEELKKDIVFETSIHDLPFVFHSTWGLFSPQHIDEGTQLLLNHLEVGQDATTLDIGCGYGVIGLAMARLAPQGFAHLIDKDFVAVEYTQKNAAINKIPNCKAYLSNAFSHVPDTKFDLIVSNLPAKPERELFDLIFFDAKRHLKPGGQLWVVTIAGLKEFIKKNFHDVFGNYQKIKQGRQHVVAMTINR